MVYRVFVQRKSPRIASETFVIPSGFEPETHSLEGCCSIQLSYGTSHDFSEIGCKGRHFFGFHQISDLKSYVTPVVEGIISLNKGFGGLELANI